MDNESVGISHSIEQLLLFGIFFEESQFVAGAFNNFAYALYCRCGKGFVWCRYIVGELMSEAPARMASVASDIPTV